jgi:hypothetical protein
VLGPSKPAIPWSAPNPARAEDFLGPPPAGARTPRWPLSRRAGRRWRTGCRRAGNGERRGPGRTSSRPRANNRRPGRGRAAAPNALPSLPPRPYRPRAASRALCARLRAIPVRFGRHYGGIGAAIRRKRRSAARPGFGSALGAGEGNGDVLSLVDPRHPRGGAKKVERPLSPREFGPSSGVDLAAIELTGGRRTPSKSPKHHPGIYRRTRRTDNRIPYLPNSAPNGS